MTLSHNSKKELFMHKQFDKLMKENDIYYSVVSINRLETLIEQIKDSIENKIEDNELSEYISYVFNFKVRDSFPEAKSIIIAAKYNPTHKVTFMKDAKEIEAIIPPGYVNFRSKQIALQQTISGILASLNYRAERIILPVKLLAVESGLGIYGKNNLCYLPEIGSYHYLGSFMSDMPNDNENWQGMINMNVCDTCNKCLHNCPSGAIDDERFLIHAEKCLTYFNRNPGIFPDSLNPAWHNSLFGCIKCQEICPMNAKVSKKIEVLEAFTESETKEILSGEEFNNYSEILKTKLNNFGFPELHSFLSRNLKALIQANEI